eukprot:7083980-Lingulodinium_polyedra.AAC.1
MASPPRPPAPALLRGPSCGGAPPSPPWAGPPAPNCPNAPAGSDGGARAAASPSVWWRVMTATSHP